MASYRQKVVFLLTEYFEMVFLEILPSAYMAGFPRAGHIFSLLNIL